VSHSIATGEQTSSIVDKNLRANSGGVIFVVGLVLVAASLWFASALQRDTQAWFVATAIFIAIVTIRGMATLQPNQSLVCLLFGRYVGTEHRSGLWWVNPLYSRRKISRRFETLECGPLKVNDVVGNPIDIGAVIVWRVGDAAKALLEVESYSSYVKAQSETALRRIVANHPYDQIEAEDALDTLDTVSERSGEDLRAKASNVALRDGGDAITDMLVQELRTRMEPIGVSIIEARISHLAYSPEIASAMLRKQAAGAVVAARRLIARGAVSIVDDALKQLEERSLADALDPERKAAMISNLLVVLVGDREVAPVINTGTLYA